MQAGAGDRLAPDLCFIADPDAFEKHILEAKTDVLRALAWMLPAVGFDQAQRRQIGELGIAGAGEHENMVDFHWCLT